MSVETGTNRPRPTGSIRGRWRERFGEQAVDVSVDPGSHDPEVEFRVTFERRWGPQIGDRRRQDFQLTREGAEVVRDALTAALEWEEGDS